MFLESTTSYLFSGDVIYDGKMYLHLKDSSFSDFDKTIRKICEFLEAHSNIQIWPAHNTIPLPKEFPRQVRKVIEVYLNGQMSLSGIWPKDAVFEEGQIYKLDNVEFIVRSKCELI